MWLVRSHRKDDPRHRVSRTPYVIVHVANVWCSINCRLPQTPRTPSTAAAHYFDDTFSRSATMKPTNGTKPHRVRRSSTARSIGNLSSHNTGINGYDDDAMSYTTSGPAEDDEEVRAANAHVANYVANQLERVRSNEMATPDDDEFEAQLDGN